MATTLKIRNYDGPSYFVTASFVSDLNLTDPSENIAWDGSAVLYKDGKGNWYVSWHSGNSNHREQNYRIKEIEALTLQRMCSEGANSDITEYLCMITSY